MNLYEVALIFHLLGVVFGLGGATVSDVLFLKSIKDERITQKEKSFLEGASLVIWIGIAILLISGAFMFWANWDVLSGQARMQAHVSIGIIIILNGLFLNFFISPKMLFWSKEKDLHKEAVLGYRKIRRIAFISGAVSLTSWYSAFVLGIARRFVFPTFSYTEIIGAYLFILALAILAALLVENISNNKYPLHTVMSLATQNRARKTK